MFYSRIARRSLSFTQFRIFSICSIHTAVLCIRSFLIWLHELDTGIFRRSAVTDAAAVTAAFGLIGVKGPLEPSAQIPNGDGNGDKYNEVFHNDVQRMQQTGSQPNAQRLSIE